ANDCLARSGHRRNPAYCAVSPCFRNPSAILLHGAGTGADQRRAPSPVVAEEFGPPRCCSALRRSLRFVEPVARPQFGIAPAFWAFAGLCAQAGRVKRSATPDGLWFSCGPAREEPLWHGGKSHLSVTLATPAQWRIQGIESPGFVSAILFREFR